MKYSIIIPAYNAEKTIIRTLESLIFDTDIPYEVIVVNDGSTDNTQNVVEQFIKSYDFMHILYQKNNGVSSARNFGTRYAKGKYVIYVDSDDFFEKDALSVIDTKNVDEDLLIFGFKHMNSKNVWQFEEGSLTLNNLLDKFDYVRSLGVVCAKVFKRSILVDNNLLFDETQDLCYGEDTLFIYSYLKYCKKINCISDILYLIDTFNDNSLSRKPQENLLFVMRKIIRFFLDLKSTNQATSIVFLNWLRIVLINEIRLGNESNLKSLLKEMNSLLPDTKLVFSKKYSIYENILLFFYKNKMYSMVILIMKLRVKQLFKREYYREKNYV